MKEYGPDVICDFTNNIESTHRPGNTGPFFCMACGSTKHQVVKQEIPADRIGVGK